MLAELPLCQRQVVRMVAYSSSVTGGLSKRVAEFPFVRGRSSEFWLKGLLSEIGGVKRKQRCPSVRGRSSESWLKVLLSQTGRVRVLQFRDFGFRE